MIAIVQRVASASVSVNKDIISSIAKGYLIFLGVCKNDVTTDSTKLAHKISGLRIMADKENKMSQSIIDVNGEILVVSQFTLCAEMSGRRPSFTKAKDPKAAEKLYEHFVSELKKHEIRVQTGQFGAMMEVSLINEGPVTFIITSS